MVELTNLYQKLATYLNSEQIEKIKLAHQVAESAHQGQNRTSGEPYISHPIAVALILANMHLDHQSIMAALLHDVLEDTLIKKVNLVEIFGSDIAELVDGVSKLTVIKFESKAEAQAENLRKMMLAMTRDIRVILIKLADRLHNMRTLNALNPDKQRRIARETLEIYAPIANRLGINTVRIEFEDLGFSYLYPMRYRILREAVLKARGNRRQVIDAFISTLNNRLSDDNIAKCRIIGREKHLYSLYLKMRKKDLSLSEIMDVYAVRLITTNVDSCYRILGVVHNLYKPIPGKFKDYIAMPKANGYQSLHTTVVGIHGVPVEIQIRTEEMERLAENGIAAHWLYKAPANTPNEAEIRARLWLKEILEIQEHAGNSLEFIEHVKIDLYPDEVYVFTPKGDILSLPRGATCVDFAYAVHTDVGHNCIAAKIDRRLVPLSSHIASGQTIEIVTAGGAHPNPTWLGFVVTGKARSNIRNWLKTQQSSESRSLGKRLLDKAFATFNHSMNEIPAQHLKKNLSELKLESIEHLYEEIGLGNQIAPLVARRLMVEAPSVDKDSSLRPLTIRGTEGMVVTYARCCHPIPGDSIVGFLSAGRGIVIHRESCRNVFNIQKNPEKYIFVQWDDVTSGEFPVDLRVEVLNKRGVLATLANAITEEDANIKNVFIDERDSRHSTINFALHIKDRSHLAKLIRSLRQITAVTRVTRAK